MEECAALRLGGARRRPTEGVSVDSEAPFSLAYNFQMFVPLYVLDVDGEVVLDCGFAYVGLLHHVIPSELGRLLPSLEDGLLAREEGLVVDALVRGQFTIISDRKLYFRSRWFWELLSSISCEIVLYSFDLFSRRLMLTEYTISTS